MGRRRRLGGHKPPFVAEPKWAPRRALFSTLPSNGGRKWHSGAKLPRMRFHALPVDVANALALHRLCERRIYIVIAIAYFGVFAVRSHRGRQGVCIASSKDTAMANQA